MGRTRRVHRALLRFIDCHRRVSIINHLHCNRPASRSDTEAPGRFSASAYNSRNRQVVSIYNAMATMEMCRTPKCCHLSYPASDIRTAESVGARHARLRRRIDAPCVASRCIRAASYAPTNGETCLSNGNDLNNMYVDLPRLD